FYYLTTCGSYPSWSGIIAHIPNIPRVRPQPKETEEQTSLETRAVQRRPGAGAGEIVGKVHAEIGFLQDIKQTGHGPAAQDFRFQMGERGGIRLALAGGDANPATRPLENFDPWIRGHAHIEVWQGLRHLGLEVRDERVDGEWFVEGLIIGG